jgi:hypothetical protein
MRMSPKSDCHDDCHPTKPLNPHGKTFMVTVGDTLFSLCFSKSLNKRERERREENKRGTVEVIGDIGKIASQLSPMSPSAASPVMPCVHGMGGRQ